MLSASPCPLPPHPAMPTGPSHPHLVPGSLLYPSHWLPSVWPLPPKVPPFMMIFLQFKYNHSTPLPNNLLIRDVLKHLMLPQCYWPECLSIHLHNKSLATGISFCKNPQQCVKIHQILPSKYGLTPPNTVCKAFQFQSKPTFRASTPLGSLTPDPLWFIIQWYRIKHTFLDMCSISIVVRNIGPTVRLPGLRSSSVVC